MDEMRESPLKFGINELEKTFQEYKYKLESAEQEAKDIVNRAWQKAEEIISDKQKEAQQIVDETMKRVTKEADNIIREAKNRANEIEKEATDKAKKEAKDSIKREVEKIERNIADTKLSAEKQSAELIDQAKKEAEEIVREAKESAQTKAFEESQAIIAEAREKAKKIDEDSIARADETDALITEVCGKTEDICNLFKTQVQTGLTDLAIKLNKARDKLEIKSVLDNNEVGINDNDKISDNSYLQGRRELNIVQPYDRIQIRKLVEAIKQIPSVKIDGEAGTEEEFSIFLIIAEPIPLLNILHGLSVVESCDVRGNTIKLQLKHSKNGDRELIYSKEENL